MESQPKRTDGITYYDHKSNSDKHYFGGYLNQALNNYTVIEKLFEQKFEESLENFLQKNKKVSYAQWERMLNFLKHHFPVVHYIDLPVREATKDNPDPFPRNDAERRQHFITTFTSIKKLLFDLRNFYSHYFHEPIDTKIDTLSHLDQIFVAVCEHVKTKRMKTDETRLLLKETLADELTHLFILKEKELLELKKKVGITGKTTAEEVRNAIFNDSFKHLYYEKQPSRIYRSSLQEEAATENGITISQSGLSLILSFFLSKREMEGFKSRLRGLKGRVLNLENGNIDLRNNSLRFMATHWVFSYLCFKGPNQKLNTSYLEETLLVQIIDELTKVPHEVYEALHVVQRDKFVEDINEFMRQDLEDGSEENALVVHPVIRKRCENKFNYFALRYLDEFAGFKTLRFQINIGNYIHDRRSKELKSGSFITDREVKERINVFGRLSAVTTLKDDFFRSESYEGSSWERFPNPSYNINGNNIAIYLDLGKDHGKDTKVIYDARSKRNKKEERVDRSNGKPTKDDILKELQQAVEVKSDTIHRKEPTALLSLHELPALLYELLVNHVKPETIETILAGKISERLKVIQEYTPQSDLPLSQIPKNLKVSGQEPKVQYDKLIRLIDNLIAAGEDKSALISKNQREIANPKIKRNFVFTITERGREANWLANDIKRFMPESTKGQWKGYHHSQLQEILAFYFARKQDAISLLNSVWQLKQSDFGASLEVLFLKPGFDSFYIAYLQNRKEHLGQIRDRILQYQSEKNVIKKVLKSIDHIFPKKVYTIRSTQDQIENLLGKPIAFSRGIFDSKPTFITDTTFEGNEHLFADWYRTSRDKSIAFQSFYNLPKDYSELISHAKETGKRIHDLSARVKMNTDLNIKNVQIKDFFLKKIADALFQKCLGQTFANSEGNDLANLTLEQLYLEREERKQINLNAKLQYQRKPGSLSNNIYNDSFIWNKPIQFKADQIEESKVKLKDLGKIKRFIADTKVTQLLAYAPTRVWSIGELEDELNLKARCYETIRREQILKDLFNFEKQILTSLNFNGQVEPPSLAIHTNHKFRAYVAEGVLRRKGHIESASWLINIDFEKTGVKELREATSLSIDSFLLVLIRNKFMHNQLPPLPFYEFMCERYPKNEGETFSEFFFRIAAAIMKKLINLDVKIAVA